MSLPNTPFIRSRINGIIIPMHPDQAGIMHRFAQPENQIVISEVSAQGRNPNSERGATLHVPATPDPASTAQATQTTPTEGSGYAAPVSGSVPATNEAADPAPVKTKRTKRAVPAVNTNAIL